MATALDVERQARVTELDRQLADIASKAWSALAIANAQDLFTGQVLPELLPDLVEAQRVAAEIGGAYVAASARQTPSVRVNPSMFAGIASDGRDLVSLLSQPLIGTYVAFAAGATPVAALATGAHQLERILTTQVHDAARGAESVTIAATPRMTGHERVVELGACSRCIVLAGRIYRWSDGFLRHPGCRCSMRPWYGPLYGGTDQPKQIFDRMSPDEQVATFGADDAKAIRDGADISQVVNAHRGMATAAGNVKVTTEGTTRHGIAGRALLGRPRLMPESIFRLASDRDDAVRMLRANGYIL